MSFDVGHRIHVDQWFPSIGHVNNVSYLRYAESSRINYLSSLSRHVPREHKREWDEIRTPQGLGLILKAATLDFKFVSHSSTHYRALKCGRHSHSFQPLKYPDTTTTYHRLGLSSTSSLPSFLPLHTVTLSHTFTRPAFRMSEEILLYDYRLNRKAALTPLILEVLQMALAEEEASKNLWVARRREVEELLEGLERSSWKKKGAVEDFGSRG